MKQYIFTVHFETGVEIVTASCALAALMEAMLKRWHLQDRYATHIVDEKRNKTTVDNKLLMRVLS